MRCSYVTAKSPLDSTLAAAAQLEQRMAGQRRFSRSRCRPLPCQRRCSRAWRRCCTAPPPAGPAPSALPSSFAAGDFSVKLTKSNRGALQRASTVGRAARRRSTGSAGTGRRDVEGWLCLQATRYRHAARQGCLAARHGLASHLGQLCYLSLVRERFCLARERARD